MPDSFLHLDDVRIAYDVQQGDADAPVVVALHGLSSSRASEDTSGFFGWAPVAAAGRTLVRYDARAHGRSTGRQQPSDLTWTALAQDLFALLEVVSPGAPVDAIGVSMGTGTLLTAAVQEPDRFRRLALVIPPTAWETRPGQADFSRSAADVVETQGLDGLARAFAAAPPLPLLEAGGWWPLPLPDITEALIPTVFRGAATADLPAADAIRTLRHDVLLRPWTGDPGHPVSTAERLAELLPNATLEIMSTPDDLRGLGARIATYLAN